jgi:hypothetical protein
MVLSARSIVPDVEVTGIVRTVDGIGPAVTKSLPAVGQHLLRRNVIKFTIPVVSVPLNAALDFYFTGFVAHQVRDVLAEKSDMRGSIISFLTAEAASPRLLLEAIWRIIIADEKVTEGESIFINNLVGKLYEIEGGEETIGVLKEMQDISEEQVLERLSKESGEVKKTIYEVLADTAAIDRKIQRKERKVLEKYAKVCGVAFDPKDLKLRAKRKKS